MKQKSKEDTSSSCNKKKDTTDYLKKITSLTRKREISVNVNKDKW